MAPKKDEEQWLQREKLELLITHSAEASKKPQRIIWIKIRRLGRVDLLLDAVTCSPTTPIHLAGTSTTCGNDYTTQLVLVPQLSV
ncbi:hypothetical protein pipiens_015152 [Culex pipiens pipiens]|uniref:Uncharacterized protein n=1 Tax=Culex pipiens pipiens TaxID=38569 RepID=A0ABD1CRQ1_CULPP